MKNRSTDLQKMNQISRQETSLQLQEHHNLDSKAGQLSVYKDSSNLQYSIQIWPRGTVSFSPETGFAGEAEKILIKGKAAVGKVASSLNTVEQHHQSNQQVVLRQKAKDVLHQMSKVVKSSPAWKWQLAGLIVLAFASWFVYRKLSKRFNLNH